MVEVNLKGCDIMYADKVEYLRKIECDACYEKLKHASDELKNDKEVVIATIRAERDEQTLFPGSIFSLASDELRKDKDFVLSLYNEHGLGSIYLYKACHYSLRTEADIVHAALKNNDDVFEYLIDEDKVNMPLMIELAKNKPELYFNKYDAWCHCLQECFSNKELVLNLLEAKQFKGGIVGYLGESLRADRDVAKKIISICPDEFHRLDPELKCDKEIALLAIHGNPDNLGQLSSRLKNDYDIIMVALNRASEIDSYLDSEHLGDMVRREICKFQDEHDEMIDDRTALSNLMTIRFKERIESELVAHEVKGGKADALLDQMARSPADDKPQQRATRNKI